MRLGRRRKAARRRAPDASARRWARGARRTLSRHRAAVASAVRFALLSSLAAAAGGALAAGGGAPWAAPFVAWTLLSGLGASLAVLAGAGLLRGSDGRPLRRPGPGNALTLLRFVLTGPVAVLLLHRVYGGAVVLYGILVLTDVADGIVARRRHETSAFGVVMDPLADIASTFAVFSVFLVDNLVPLWLYLLLAARYVLLLGGSLALSLAVGPPAYRATATGKVVGVVQAVGAGWVMLGARDGGLDPRVADPLFAVLGLGFASVVVSQGVIGWRHIRRAARGRAVQRGSSR